MSDKTKENNDSKREKKTLKQRKREAELLEMKRWGHVKDQRERY